jgi:phage/plasmid-like protein (TIGR03299 family)
MLWDTLMPESLQWEVKTRPIYNYNGMEIPGKREVYRTDTEQHYGIVSPDYTPLQNASCAEFLSTVDGSVEKCGVFANGAKVWWVMKLPGSMVIAGEMIHKYSVMVNAHDGTLGFRWFVTPIRPRCSNMMNILIKHAIDFNISTRHTLNIATRVEAARSIFGQVNDVYSEIEQAFTAMATIMFDSSELKKYVASVLQPTDQEGTRFKTAMGIITENYYSDYIFTDWGAFNAVTKYLEHQRPLRGPGQDERRFSNSLFGVTVKAKQRAYDMLQRSPDGRPNYFDYVGHRIKRDTGAATIASGIGSSGLGMDEEEG